MTKRCPDRIIMTSPGAGYRWPLLACIALLLSGCAQYAGRMVVATHNDNTPPGIVALDPGEWTEISGSEFARLDAGAGVAANVFKPAPYIVAFETGPDGCVPRQPCEFTVTFRADLEHRQDASELPRGTVVLLHGYAMNRFSMTPYAMMFADAGYTTLAIDLPGHGDSPADVITYGVREAPVIGELRQVLSSGNYRRPYILAGVSYGGSLAMRSAALDAGWDLVVAIQPFANPRAVIPNFRAMLPRPWRWFAGEATTERALVYAARRADFTWESADLLPLMADYATPTLILHSRDDELVPLSQSEALASAASGSIDLVISEDGGGHMAFPFPVWARCTDILPWLDARVELPRPATRSDTCERFTPRQPPPDIASDTEPAD